MYSLMNCVTLLCIYIIRVCRLIWFGLLTEPLTALWELRYQRLCQITTLARSQALLHWSVGKMLICSGKQEIFCLSIVQISPYFGTANSSLQRFAKLCFLVEIYVAASDRTPQLREIDITYGSNGLPFDFSP